MSYLNSAKGLKITRSRVLSELKKHGLGSEANIVEFDAEVKPENDGMYNATKVLYWLGY